MELELGSAFLPTLKRMGIELDQRMHRAWEWSAQHAADEDGEIWDVEFFVALCKQNPLILQHLLPNGTASEALSSVDWLNKQPGHLKKVKPAEGLLTVINSALKHLGTRRTLGSGDYLRALLESLFETGDSYTERLFTLDLLAEIHTGDIAKPLSDIPSLRTALEQLQNRADGINDYQYILTLSGDQLAFRVVSTLGDYIQQNQSGLWVPHRAILTHFRETFGGFTQDEIQELEELINSSIAKESDFQTFFEKHQHFLRRWDYREVYPHLVLWRPEGELIPDFILTDVELQRAAILELKLPRPKLIRRQRNRDRFATAVIEAKTQLLRYRDWFREKENRLAIKKRVGFEVYEPQLITVIGRSSEFQDEIDRQRLKSDNPDLEVVTYDDLLTFAQRRIILLD